MFYNFEYYNCYIENVMDDTIVFVVFDDNLKNLSRNKILSYSIRWDIIWFHLKPEEEVIYKSTAAYADSYVLWPDLQECAVLI